MSDRDTFIQRLTTARAEIREIVKLARDNPTIYAPWRMKEVLDHITGWDDAIIASIRSMLSGEIPATPAARGLDAYNAETVSSRETIPYEVSQRECEASRAVLLDLIQKMTEEQLHASFVLPWGAHGSIETLVEIFTEHEETHAKEIREIIEKVK
ncbi:MAG TPA: ClbS/DfsB family four-helix bundle protein [Anaerolineales bacterium]|nr:ClbS/DfsB family four-helix bundle protein [Anaerolineales bacterium]